MAKDIKKDFNQFGGQEVAMVVTGGQIALAAENPVIKAIEEVAKKHRVSLRFFWPTNMTSADEHHKPSRVNVTIERVPFTKKFRIGSVDIG